jgi:hypothetical protein
MGSWVHYCLSVCSEPQVFEPAKYGHKCQLARILCTKVNVLWGSKQDIILRHVVALRGFRCLALMEWDGEGQLVLSGFRLLGDASRLRWKRGATEIFDTVVLAWDEVTAPSQEVGHVI